MSVKEEEGNRSGDLVVQDLSEDISRPRSGGAGGPAAGSVHPTTPPDLRTTGGSFRVASNAADSYTSPGAPQIFVLPGAAIGGWTAPEKTKSSYLNRIADLEEQVSSLHLEREGLHQQLQSGEKKQVRISTEIEVLESLCTAPSKISTASYQTSQSSVTTVMTEIPKDSDMRESEISSMDMNAYETEHFDIGTYMPTLMSEGTEPDDRFPSWVHTGVKIFSYLLAVGGVVFVLVAKGKEIGKSGENHEGPPDLLEMIAFCLTCAGLMSFFVNILKQPLILGYLLAGVVVGPICLDIVHNVSDIQDFSSLGLVFLLFMVGLELDVKQLLQMGKVVLITGFMQFPVCVALHLGFFLALSAMGVEFGEGDKSLLYCALTCGISSTMIVAKLLSLMSDMDSPCGRLTVGILIFQDIWAIIILAIQPDLANPQITKLLRQFGMILLLIAVAMAYARWIMPVVFDKSSKNVEMMLCVSVSWCFFVCCCAILPFIGLSMELAALISGVALAPYPYTAEFNGKIKYIRDFFITIFFCGLGMQIPQPTTGPILTALLIAVVVLLCRWVGIFTLVKLLGGDTKLATVATINLSEVSEFALVICSLGIKYEHVNEDTLTILIWVFALLAILSANVLPYNYKIYAMLIGLTERCRCRGTVVDSFGHTIRTSAHEDRSIVILGFHKIAAMLVQNIQRDSPEMVHKIQVVDFNEKTLFKLKSKGIGVAYGDISSPDVLEHAVHGEARLVIISIPDYKLRGTSNSKLLKIAHQVWPEAKVIVNSDNPVDTEQLYKEGADYVLRMSELCADDLGTLLQDYTKTPTEGPMATCRFVQQQNVDMKRIKDSRISFVNFR